MSNSCGIVFGGIFKGGIPFNWSGGIKGTGNCSVAFILCRNFIEINEIKECMINIMGNRDGKIWKNRTFGIDGEISKVSEKNGENFLEISKGNTVYIHDRVVL